MKLKQFFLIAVLLIAVKVDAQSFLTDSAAAAEHHHTPWDILTGDGSDEIVCYKQAHRNMYFVVTGLIVIIALVALKLLQTNRKNNKLLQAQKDLIEEKNKDITDSINYASRIQRSLLPQEKYIQKNLDRLNKK